MEIEKANTFWFKEFNEMNAKEYVMLTSVTVVTAVITYAVSTRLTNPILDALDRRQEAKRLRKAKKAQK